MRGQSQPTRMNNVTPRSFLRILFLALIVGLLTQVGTAQAAGTISLTTLGGTYTEDFNTLASSGTSSDGADRVDVLRDRHQRQYSCMRPARAHRTPATPTASARPPAPNAPSADCSAARLTPLVGAQFTNNTGATITSLGVAYTGEQWRAGVTNRNAADRLDFQLSTNATSLSTGTWTDYDSLDFNSPKINTGQSVRWTATPPAIGAALSFTITGLSIANGSSYWVRWADFNITSSDDGLAVDDFSLTPNGVAPPPTLSINDVSANEGNSGTTSFDFTVSLGAPAGAGGVTFDIATQDGTATVADNDYVAKSLSGQTIPAGSSTYAFSVLVNGDTATEPDETFSVNVTNVVGAAVGDGAGQGTIVNDDVCGLLHPTRRSTRSRAAACPPRSQAPSRPRASSSVTSRAPPPRPASTSRISTGDGDPATSDGIFVFTGSDESRQRRRQVVRVTGFARERFNQTTLNGSDSNSAAVPAANIVSCGSGSVAPTDVTLPFADANVPERYEGMLVRFPQSLVISEYFNYDRFGEIVLAQPLAGESRPFTGTAIDEPGAAANARTAANALSRITLDDAQSAQNPSVLRHPNGLPFSLGNLFRGGDLVTDTVGVLGYDFSLYRVYPDRGGRLHGRQLAPGRTRAVGGTVRVAAMNTLNFFVTADYPSGALDNKCGPLNNVECRGWDSDQATEFTRQRDKLLAALSGLDADIVGLNELENSTGVEALDSIVSGLPGYAYIATGTIGTDAIKVGLIYRPAVVSPVGSFQVLDSTDDPRFIDTKSRPSLAQTFEVNATGARFTVVVNHLKSKGSDCLDVGDPDLLDGQGNCSQTRRAAAEALVDWLDTDPTGSGDPDFLIMGDLNSYAQEDTIDEIKAGSDDVAGTGDDFTNLISHFQGLYAYSYTFDGQAGYLDHALANASLFAQITGAADWHINSDEPDVLDYDTSFKPAAQDALYEPNAYRSSDHDPVRVGLTPLSEATSLEITGTFYDDNLAPTLLTARLTGAGACNVGGRTVSFYVDLNGDGVFTDAPDELVGTGVTSASGIAQYAWIGSSTPPGRRESGTSRPSSAARRTATRPRTSRPSRSSCRATPRTAAAGTSSERAARLA